MKKTSSEDKLKFVLNGWYMNLAKQHLPLELDLTSDMYLHSLQLSCSVKVCLSMPCEKENRICRYISENLSLL